MKLFVGETPKNPFEAEEKYMNRIRQMAYDAYAMGQKSILQQCVDIDIETLACRLWDSGSETKVEDIMAVIEEYIEEMKQEKGK